MLLLVSLAAGPSRWRDGLGIDVAQGPGFHVVVGETFEVDIHQGDTMWREAEEHSALNIGTGELRALFIELK